jgi:DNA-binding FadR family transcriptional regulator
MVQWSAERPVWSGGQRLPSLIAEELRTRILEGELGDGARLPKEETLRNQFGVGRPVMREALRILEAEGLIVIVRGNKGGAVVRKPQPAHTAYALSLLLSSKGVKMRDVGRALAELEPICAALCAQRTDRRTAVVPALRRIHEASADALDEPDLVTRLFREFHETTVAHCGNQTLNLLVGALEEIWSMNVRSSKTRSSRPRPRDELQHSYEEHARILRCIETGDVAGAKVAVAGHIARVQSANTKANDDRRYVVPSWWRPARLSLRASPKEATMVAPLQRVRP